MKNIVILGSTGSVGRSALEVVDYFPDRLKAAALAAGRNSDLLLEQVSRYRPEAVALGEEAPDNNLRDLCRKIGCETLYGPEAAVSLACMDQAQTVVSAMVGAVGLKPTLAAAAAGKRIALANKEVLVMAGSLLMEEARRGGAEILPVDSEHNAIFQCLQGHKREALRRVLLCSTGGPFLHRRIGSLRRATVEEALNHPRWRMGRKISIDSATMMNKGLEMIEACRLFSLTPDQIEVVIHPQAIVHSLIEFSDGSLLAQLSIPDMRVPIQYCLSYPERWRSPHEPLDLVQASPLEFFEPDPKKFPALTLAREAMREGGTMPAVLAAADETAVGAFLNEIIFFTDIMSLVETVMSRHKPSRADDIDSILAADVWAREETQRLLEDIPF